MITGARTPVREKAHGVAAAACGTGACAVSQGGAGPDRNPSPPADQRFPCEKGNVAQCLLRG